jgi:hypothetical protein
VHRTLAAKAEVAGKSLDFAVVPVRSRPRAPTRRMPLRRRAFCVAAAFFLVLGDAPTGLYI